MVPFSERLKEAKRLIQGCSTPTMGDTPIAGLSITSIWGSGFFFNLAISTLTELLSILGLVKYGIVADETVSLSFGNLFPHDCDCFHANVLCLGHRTC